MTSNQLKEWRRKTGYSQGKLARVLGVDVMTISRWERDIRAIPPFLHITLECVEMKGDELLKSKGKKKKKERKVKE